METYQLQSDLLAKGMTKTAKILWVPFNLALMNIGAVFMLGLLLYVITQAWWCFALAGGFIAINHLLLAIWSLRDDKAVELAIKDRLLCDARGKPVNRYSPFASHAHKAIPESFVEQHIPYTHAINDYTVMTQRGDMLQVLKLDGIPFDAKIDADIDSQKLLRNRLMYQIANPNIALYFYHARNKVTEQVAGEFPHAFAREFVEAFNAQQQSYYRNDLYIVLIRKTGLLSGKKRKPQDNPEQQNNQNLGLDELNSLSLRFEQMFSAYNCQRLDNTTPVSLNSFLARTINHDYRKIGPCTGKLKHHLGYTHLRFAKGRGIVEITYPCGKIRYASLLSFKEYPEATHASILDVLLGFPAELSISQSFLFQSPRLSLKELRIQQRKLDKTDDSEILADDLSEAMEEVKAGRTAYGDHHFSVALLADSIDELNRKTEALDSELNQKAEIIMLRETQGVELAFFAQIPGNFSYRVRHGLIGALNMASFASLHNYPAGKATGNHWGDSLAILETVAKTPYHFNFHVDQVGNSMFIGPMGSGKTLLLSAFLLMSNKYGGWRYVFDKDRGMEPLIRALGADYRGIKPGKPSGMAPLQLADTPANRAFNTLLLKKILGNNKPLRASEEAQIERAILGVFALDKEQRTFSNLAPFLGTASEGNLRERFDRWCGEGQNAWLFDNPKDVFSIEGKLSGQDIGEILKKEHAEIRTVALMYIFHRLEACLDSSPTLVFIPEGWQVLEDDMFKAQLLDWSKTPRKKNMALIMDTQNPADLAKSDAGCALVQESVTQVFFANEKAVWSDYEKFKLNDKEFFIIQEVLPAMKNEHYFLLKQGGNSVVVRLNLKALARFIPVLSGSQAGVFLLDALRARLGNAPECWLSAFQALEPILKTQYQGAFPKMEPHLERHLKEIGAC